MGWAEPRSLRQRYGAILDGLTHSQRKDLLTDLTKSMARPVIPEEERHHLCVIIHHGHWQGATKCQGDKALCARCLQGGYRHEETVMHEVHECSAGQKVWETVANQWQATTGLSLDITAPSLTVMGLRPEPGESEPQAAKDRFHMPRSRHGAYYTP